MLKVIQKFEKKVDINSQMKELNNFYCPQTIPIVKILPKPNIRKYIIEFVKIKVFILNLH